MCRSANSGKTLTKCITMNKYQSTTDRVPLFKWFRFSNCQGGTLSFSVWTNIKKPIRLEKWRKATVAPFKVAKNNNSQRAQFAFEICSFVNFLKKKSLKICGKVDKKA